MGTGGGSKEAHNLCLEQKLRKKNQKFSSENHHFYSCEKSQYIAWTCYCNVKSYLDCFFFTFESMFFSDTVINGHNLKSQNAYIQMKLCKNTHVQVSIWYLIITAIRP